MFTSLPPTQFLLFKKNFLTLLVSFIFLGEIEINFLIPKKILLVVPRVALNV